MILLFFASNDLVVISAITFPATILAVVAAAVVVVFVVVVAIVVIRPINKCFSKYLGNKDINIIAITSCALTCSYFSVFIGLFLLYFTICSKTTAM